MYLDPTSAAAAQHRQQLLTDASRARLARIATCCRSSLVVRQARTLLAWARGFVRPCCS